MGRKMTTLYDKLDPVFEKSASQLTLSCKAGCAGCCYQLTLVSLPEAVAIAEYFLMDTQRRGLIPLLMRSFLEQAGKIPPGDIKAIRQEYFHKKVPCTFLDEETKLCTIYPVRPSACRYHAVVTDPALCQPEAGIQEVGFVDTRVVTAHVLSEANRVSKQTKIPLFLAPLPVMMLWAFKLLIEGRAAFELALKDDGLGSLGLKEWSDLYQPIHLPPPPETAHETPAPGSD